MPSTAASETTSCAVSTVDKTLVSSRVLDRRKILGISTAVWIRSLHYNRRVSKPQVSVSRGSSWASGSKSGSGNGGAINREPGRRIRRVTSGKPLEELGNGRYSDRILKHRLSKDEMLAAATGFFQRLSIRAKWWSIRQMRPYNVDDITAFFSWLFLGHILWIVLGTTTFVSLSIFLCNTVFAQEFLAGAVGNYLTKETGVKVVFESAIVPKWKDGCISFKNVFVARRPGTHGDKNVQKGSSSTAAAAAAAAVAAAYSGDVSGESHVQYSPEEEEEAEDENVNYTQFDVTIDTVNVTLSLAKWMNGKGLLKDVEIKGVRGVIDRTSVTWDEDVDPKTYRYQHQPGDFEIESFRLEDLLVTVHQPDGFPPFSVSIFSCDLPRLRKQWLFYDFLSANIMSGCYDDSLFTIHPRQSHVNKPEAPSDSESKGDAPIWKKTTRLRIDGLSVGHFNRGVQGPFSWIHSGKVDIVADIVLPMDDDSQLTKVVQHIVETVGAATSAKPRDSANASTDRQTDQKFIIMDLRIQLNDVRAAVPVFSKDLSYANSALIRPIVAYINSRRTCIPINCRVIKRADEFDGSWTIFDSGLMDDLSAEVGFPTTLHARARSLPFPRTLL